MARIPGFDKKQVRVSIPRKSIICAYHSDNKLTRKEKAKYAHKKREIEHAILQLSHINSIVGLLLLRNDDEKDDVEFTI